jgi:hypothetical protein
MEDKRRTGDGQDGDIAARIEELREQAGVLNKRDLRSWFSPDCPPGIEEQFWRQVIAFEQAPEVEPFETLVRSGLSLPAPDELDDAALTATLWALIRALAALRIHLHSTDHLSDRELYVHLWSDVLRERMAIEPGDEGADWHIDIIGKWGEEDIRTYLMYYADDDARREWMQDRPGEPLPDARPLPFDRDRHLPTSCLPGF